MPVSVATFQLSLQFLRLSFPVSENPAFSFPRGSLWIPPNAIVKNGTGIDSDPDLDLDLPDRRDGP